MLTRARSTAAALAFVLLLAGCTGPTPREQVGEPADGSSTTVTSEQRGGSGDTTASFGDIPAIVDAVGPSVVAVLAGQGEGSGVVYDEGGTIVTNAHVVGNLEEVEVAFADGERVRAEVVATDTIVDLAVLQAERDDLPAAEFAEELPDIGELAIAIGNPLGFEGSVTAGIISGLDRAIPGSATQTQALVDLIQTDAAISPGNSGGALVNGAGEVVGINVAYIPPAARAVSLGFAIPAPTVVDVVEELLEDGQATHPFLGVSPAAVTPDLAERFDLPVDAGVLIQSVSRGGPAEAAGMEPGDIITAIDGDEVRTVEDFLGILRDLDPGDGATFTINRDGEEQQLEVEIGARPVVMQ